MEAAKSSNFTSNLFSNTTSTDVIQSISNLTRGSSSSNNFQGSSGILGNILISNGQWVTDNQTPPDRFSSAVTDTFDRAIDVVFDKLRNRLPLNEAKDPSTTNPFADGNNPFGEGNEPKLPGLDYLKSVYGEQFPLPSGESNFLAGGTGTETQPGDGDESTGTYNPFGEGGATPNPGDDLLASTGNPFAGGGSGNPFAGGGSGNPFAGGSGNPFAGGGSGNPTAGGGSGNPTAGGGSGNPFAGGSGNPFAGGSAQFDITKLIFGGNLPSSLNSGDSSSPQQSPLETLKNVQSGILNFTQNLNSSNGDSFFGGNNTPFKTPSDLLTLFRNDMYSFNSGVNTVNELANSDESAASGSNPLSIFSGVGTPDQEIPYDIISVALDGILPFNGSDNVFMTPEGEIPIGYGNKDFGRDNATIGNANWDYGNSNATIGNANWNWDSSRDNATIGNGNWHLDNSSSNETIGNGNWYWNSTRDNATLGNGNWGFGSNNTTIGNGNWDFGNNNLVIGNGNRVFTNNSIVIGNGNWSVVLDKSTTGGGDLLAQLDTLLLGVGTKSAADDLVGSLMDKLGEVFQPLTTDLQASGLNTFNHLFSQNVTV